MIQGLPVLTVRGDSFPNRVASSLMESFAESNLLSTQEAKNFVGMNDLLVVDSFIQYEDMAVRLAKSGSVLAALKKILTEAIAFQTGIFCSICSTAVFFHGMQSMYESNFYSSRVSEKYYFERKMHVIVTNQTL